MIMSSKRRIDYEPSSMKHKKFHLHNFNTEAYFNKTYKFKCNESWALPNDVFAGSKWSVDELQGKKRALNAVKEQLNNFDLELWSMHTKKRDPSSSIIKAIRNNYRPELLTQAWCKFYECLSKNEDLLPTRALQKGVVRSLHLCEAPGGFISALNHYLVLHHPNVKLDWSATTLNPDYEGNPLNRMIPDDRLIRFTKGNWLFGADHTGDITKYYNHKYIIEQFSKNGKAELITADGSVNCMDDPGDQERNVEYLHYCEVITALSLLETGGTFIVKIFTTFEDSTICLLYLLNCSFQAVTVFKPVTSKSGNSEMYVICKNYKGLDYLSMIWEKLLLAYEARSEASMFEYKDVDGSFVRQIHECADFFMERQTRTINENVKIFVNKHNVHYENAKIRATHAEITNHFLTKYFIDSISNRSKIVPDYNVTTCYRLYKYEDDRAKYKYYKAKGDSQVLLNIKTGKKITNISYSKYCTQESLHAILMRKTVPSENSLLAITKNCVRNDCNVFDLSDFCTVLHHGEFQKQLFARIYQNYNTRNNILFINIPFLSNFLVGVLYILCSAFKCTYFLRNGIVYLKDLEPLKTGRIKEQLDEIHETYTTLRHPDCSNFEPDILEVIGGELNNYFLNSLWFFNNNLLASK